MKEQNPSSDSQQNLDSVLQSCTSIQDSKIEEKLQKEDEHEQIKEDDELGKLLLPNVEDLPNTPPSAVEANFTTFFAPDFMKPGHDQFVHRHANGLCVIGLAPTHMALKDKGGITSVDFNVGKSDRSGLKVTGKRKRMHNILNPTLHYVKCCVKGSLLEVNDRLIKQPELLTSSPDREGYIAIIMPRPADWIKAKASLLDSEQYKKSNTEL